MTESRRREFGDFLRRRRESLSPSAAGIAAHGRRRTPGLRRDEVAELSHMSLVYYERLERGRGPSPSAAMLAGLARTLRLTAHERDHLYRLVGQAPPPPPARDEPVDPGLLGALQSLSATIPAVITDDLGTVLVENRMIVAVFEAMADRAGPASNLVWRWFTDEQWRVRTEPAEQHRRSSEAYVADLRTTVGRRGPGDASAELVEGLHAVSAEFADLWARHSVAPLHCSRKCIRDERVGLLELDCSVTASQDSGQRLLLLRPVPGTAAAERLARLDALLPS